MEELHFTGNCLKGSRPILSFDAGFEAAPHWRLVKELCVQTFGVPRGARKSKPFVDHVVAFTLADGKVWVRCYQVRETEGGGGGGAAAAEEDGEKGKGKAKGTDVALVEIGPRFVMTPIVILEGSFGGPVIFENREFVSPNQLRAEIRLAKAGRYARRDDAAKDRTARKEELGLRTEGGRRRKREGEELDERVLFA